MSPLENAHSEQSFKRAVRHLFRHLEDARALRKNPLTRRNFVPAVYGGRVRDDVALTAIHSQILQAGYVCHSEDVMAGLTWRAARHLEILKGLCSRQSAADIARTLGISIPQYYRDRRSICLRAARVIQNGQDRAIVGVAICDPLQLEFRRISMLVSQGCAAKAIALGERVFRQVHSEADKVSALLRISDAAIEIGDADLAETRWRSAKSILAERSQVLQEIEILRTHAELVAFRLAMGKGRCLDATAMIDALAARFTGSDWQVCPERSDLAMTVLLEQCCVCAMAGRFAKARNVIARVDSIEQRNPLISPDLRWQIAFMKAYSAEDGSLCPDERLELLSSTLNLAMIVGSLKGALAATIGLVNHCVTLGYEDEAKEHADSAIRIARSMEGHSNLMFATDSLAPLLLRTKHWPIVDQMLVDVQKLPQSMHESMIHCKLRGQLLARRRRFQDAVFALTRAEAEAQDLQSPWLVAAIQPELALALHASGRTEEAKRRARAALRRIEDGASPGVVGSTYKAAAILLGDSGLLARARGMGTA